MSGSSGVKSLTGGCGEVVESFSIPESRARNAAGAIPPASSAGELGRREFSTEGQ
jgi:hypothetical protein